MLVGGALTSFGLSLGGLLLAGSALGPWISDALTAAVALSAFGAICATEGALAG